MRIIIFLVIITKLCSGAVLDSGLQVKRGGWRVVGFYDYSIIYPRFSIESLDKIKVDDGEYFDRVSKDFLSEGSLRGYFLKVIHNPFDGFYYFLKAGRLEFLT